MIRRSHLAFLKNQRLWTAVAQTVARPTLTSSTPSSIAVSDAVVPRTLALVGKGFLKFRSVRVGGTLCTTVTIVDDTHMTITVPTIAAGAGTRYILLETQGGQATALAITVTADWTPLSDIALQSALYLPGSYVVTGTAGVNQSGTWSDTSGNNRHLTSFTDNDGFNAPTRHALGYPIFGGAGKNALQRLGTSYSVNLSSGPSGAMITVAEQDAPLDPVIGNYQNMSITAGSAATPHFCGDSSGIRFGGYDAVAYVASTTPGLVGGVAKLFAGKWDTTGVYSSFDGAAWSAVTPYVGAGPLDTGNMGPDFYVGCGYGKSYVWKGHVKAFAVYPNFANLSTAKIAQWQVWAARLGYV